MSRFTIAENDSCKVDIQMIDGKPFFHAEVYKWSPDVYKEMKLAFEELMIDLYKRGYYAVFAFVPHDKKIIKFDKMFGFEEIESNNHGVLLGRGTINGH
jgi:hypothetical protein